MKLPIRCIVPVFVSLLFNAAAHAGTTCVSTSAQLLNALNDATSASDNVVIKLVTGNYSLSGDHDFTIKKSLSLLGGYSSCNINASVTADAFATSIDLNGGKLGLTARDDELNIETVSIGNGGQVSLAAGVYHSLLPNDPGYVNLFNARLHHLTGFDEEPAVAINLYSGQIYEENVLMDHLVGGNGGVIPCTVSIFAQDGDGGLFNYVTADFGGDFCMSSGGYYGSYNFQFNNSIFWNSNGAPPLIAAIPGAEGPQGQVLDFELTVYDSIFHSMTPSYERLNAAAIHQIDSPPQWVSPATGNYALQAASPAVNSGGTGHGFSVPAKDIKGNPRPIGSAPDMGAYESPISDQTSFVVTSLADNGPNTLRNAITLANSSPNPALIEFAIAAPCPQIIALASPLPDITTPVKIDGYSQVGTKANDDPNGFDAKVCVALQPNSRQPFALRVPSNATGAKLEVDGLGFGKFTQAMLLLGGHDHDIHGNVFGATVGTATSLDANGTDHITAGVNVTGRLTIGALEASARNVFGVLDGIGMAVQLQNTLTLSRGDCQVSGNWIGLDTDGYTLLPNNTGLNISANGCYVVGNRVVGSAYDAIWINGADQVTVQKNVIGLDTLGNVRFGSGLGVRIDGNDNVVGHDATGDVLGSYTYLSNTVNGMAQGGVRVNSGLINRVRGNTMSSNGLGNPGLDIDLGNAGPDANDNGDGDSGANYLINYPVAQALYALGKKPLPQTDVSVLITAQVNVPDAGQYRLDAYDSAGCDGQRGHAETYLGAHVVDIASGKSTVSMQTTLAALQSGHDVSLTLTDAFGNTSEIGNCISVNSAMYDTIFADDLEKH